MARNRREILQSAAAMATTVLAAPFIRRAEAAEPIKVGSLLDLSGPIGTSGQPMFDAIQLAVAEVNAGGGLLGRPIKLINYNTQSTIQLYSQYAQQLALKDRVAVVHGGITSASREAIRPVFDRYRILYFYNVLYEGGVCDRDIFCTGTTPAQTVNKLVPYALKTVTCGRPIMTTSMAASTAHNPGQAGRVFAAIGIVETTVLETTLVQTTVIARSEATKQSPAARAY